MERFYLREDGDCSGCEAEMTPNISGEYIRYTDHLDSLRNLWGRLKDRTVNWGHNFNLVSKSDIKSAFLAAGLTEDDLK